MKAREWTVLAVSRGGEREGCWPRRRKDERRGEGKKKMGVTAVGGRVRVRLRFRERRRKDI